MFMIVSFPWPTRSAYAQLGRHESARGRAALDDARNSGETQPEFATAGQRG